MTRIIDHQIQIAEAVPLGSREIAKGCDGRRSRREILARVVEILAVFPYLGDATGFRDVVDQLAHGSLSGSRGLGREKKQKKPDGKIHGSSN